MGELSLGRRWSVAAAQPIIRHDSRHLFAGRDGTILEIERTKPGDLSLTVQYSGTTSLLGKQGMLMVGAGSTFPVSGDAPVVLLDEVDYTSGTVDLLANARLIVPLSKRLTIGAGSFARVIFSDRDGQSLGDYFAYDLQSSTPIGARLSFLQRLLLVIRDQDRVDGRAYINSGSEALSWLPALSWRLPTGKRLDASLLLEAEIPIWQRMNGLQPVPAMIIRGGLQAGFNLFAKQPPRTLPLPRKR